MKSTTMSSQKVIVVGCGVFGLSTALAFAKKGYRVTALDSFETPSPWSAANDLNKIIRIEYPDEITAKLSVEALQMWESSPIYKNCFVKSGRFVLSPFDSSSKRSEYEKRSYDIIELLGVKQRIVKVTNRNDLESLVPQFKNNNLPENFNATYNYDCGVGLSSKALRETFNLAKAEGVNFIFGEDGKATGILDNMVTVASGKEYFSDIILVAAGAASGFLVPLDRQVKPFAAFVTHIKLTPEEYEKYKDIPIFFSAEIGYFFPPDEESHEIKLALTTCDGYALESDPFKPNEKVRLPHFNTDYPSQTFPECGKKDIAKVLNLIVPDLASHSLVNSKTCWTSDSCDSYFLIDKCPYYKGVYVATGDSSHAFKFLPNIGKYIVQRIEGTLSPELQEVWKWRVAPDFDGKLSSRYPRPHLNLDEIKFIDN
ncbi:uncharacterized protein PRCAT00002159001 [Priceomyces carsonii]|uniref:uncharacterized protein n=1 Tax=Priceomyces carsonii TaxID=28549 RepID=UPI002EDA281E|nr:unnamed protein product [Priceomyces carsonii]